MMIGGGASFLDHVLELEELLPRVSAMIMKAKGKQRTIIAMVRS